MNNNLVGVIVDAGHGGNDPGAVSGNLKEKDLTLKAALYMYDRLKDLGINAKLTRDDDISLPKSERIAKVKSLFDDSEDVILVSNHINAGGGEGAEIVYSLKSTPELATMALDNITEAGQISRGVYQRVLPEDPSKDYYYILRETGNVEPILVEYGFIDNKNDANKLVNNLTDYVEGVVKAIADYAGVPYIPPTGTDIEGETYTVQRGDTLYGIARKYGLTVDELKALNNLTNNEIYIGQTLQVSPIQSNRYVVQRGDTLYGIANKFKVSVNDLKEVNGLTSNILYIGQELLIPSTIQDTPDVEPLPDDNENNSNDTPDSGIGDEIIDEYDTYIVQRGDSLWTISRKFNIPLQDLILLNNLTDNVLQIGQQLLIPKQETQIYTVERGDRVFMRNSRV